MSEYKRVKVFQIEDTEKITIINRLEDLVKKKSPILMILRYLSLDKVKRGNFQKYLVEYDFHINIIDLRVMEFLYN